MRKIYLTLFGNKYGGNIYGWYLSKIPEIEVKNLIKSKRRFFKLIESFIKLFIVSLKYPNDVIIRNLDGCFFMKKSQKNIVIFHHYDPVNSNYFVRLYQKFIFYNFLSQKDKIDKVVVVSKYWERYLKKLGFKNICLIYNPFDIELYGNFSYKELIDFKKKYKLNDRPIIYLGNPLKEKGIYKAYNALKSLNVQLITSGNGKIRLPNIKHLQLTFVEYLKLLQISSISVLMSQMKEGWNRVAHESILSSTPVIGSGKGGMKELLKNTHQYICEDKKCVKEKIKLLLNNPVIYKEDLKYVKSFTIEKFKLEWQKLLSEL